MTATDAAFRTATLTPDRIAQFSAAMRDPNPVHLDPAFCASIGLPGVIAPGGIGVVAIAHAVAARYGIHAIRELDITFRSPVHSGESLTCTFDVLAEAGATATLSATALAPDGRVCADGTVTVGDPP